MWETLAKGLPHCTALLNTAATIVLAFALINIKRGKVKVHKKLMLYALGISAAFLALYLLHKVALYQTTGEPNKRFPADAPQAARYTYFSILGSHLILAIFVPFLALRAVYLAKKGRIVAHKKLVRWAYPIWMYVSVTGVLVYLMLYQLYATA
ncbi:DUF420 domain-containing protein [Rhodopirellula sp. MGV]|uniref:DUF420 domain-containing protein n=1 Tax=Rhodopirellula sp. MGV TaxID=2023130 RepID=UPI000B960920|nr:DUF420 domain-containing protein [Rhodopirellula sp. MGV]OYP29820.1 hypothetical protein CGZ80_23795 [Rhodopirellula sp. MGV]PNY33702.1 DUF420 domain-containing protein [Rhodopirellula baltica]